ANCNLILPPTHPDADAGFVIMEHVEYPGMSGTNTICVATVLLETGMVPMQEPVTELTLEAPAGLIRVRAECSSGKVRGVTFQNVPAFAVHLDRVIEVPKLGTVTVDVAYGGMFYAIAHARAAGSVSTRTFATRGSSARSSRADSSRRQRSARIRRWCPR